MIIENINTVDNIMPYLSMRLSKGLAYIRDTNFSELEDGEYEIEGKNIFVRISSYETQDKNNLRAEKHFKYVDIQYIISGSEVICYVPESKVMVECEEKNIKNDISFFPISIEGEKEYILNQQDLAVIFPWEIHKPQCNINAKSSSVRKAVVKVMLER